MMTALMLLAGMSVTRAQAPANTVLWSENWDNGTANASPADYLASDNNATVVYGDAEITYASENGSTKLYNATLAGGTAPELLLAGSDTWTITGVPTGGAAMMTLSYKSNNTKASVSSPTEGITVTANTSKAATYTYTIENDGNTTFDIVFSASGNTRLDDILLTVKGPDVAYTLTVADGIEHGTISLSEEEATEGTEITVTVTPDETYMLETLTYTYGETTANIDQETLTFEMPAGNVLVNATFKLIPTTEYNITIANITNGTVETSAETAVEGTVITVTVTPDNGYALETVTYTYGDVDPIDITTTMSFEMPAADVTINATFSALPEAYFAPVTEEPSDWTGEYLMVFQADATHLMALNQIRLVGTNYVGDTTNVYGYLNHGLIEANDNTIAIRVSVEASESGYTLNLHDNGYLGWISGNTMVAAETVESNHYEWVISFNEGKTIIANAADNNRIIKYNTGAPRFAVYSNTTTNYAQLYKYYGPAIVEPTYAINIADNIEHGNIAIEGDLTEAEKNTPIILIVTPDNGYMLETLTYTYNETVTDIDQETLTFNMPAADVTINATFKLMPTVDYNITVAEGIENGTIEASAETAVEGTVITVTVTANEGYMLETLTYVYGDVDPIDIKAAKSFEMPAADVTLNATFAELPTPEVGDILWAESWDNGAVDASPEDYLISEDHSTVVYGEAELTYASVSPGSITKLYNATMAGGTAPELLVAKNGGSFTASGIPTGGVEEMLLTYKANNPNLTLSTTTEGITITAKESKATYTYVITNSGNATFDLTFGNSESGNTRLDDILLVVKGPDPTYNLSVSESIVNGTIELSTYEAQEGDEITVTVTPDEDYMLETLTYTYGDVETIFDIDQETLTFEMPAGDVVVNATFKQIPTVEYNIIVADGIVNGTIEASAETAVEGTNITVTVTHNEGYALETLTYVYDGQDEPIDITIEKAFVMPAANVTLNATFAELPEAYFAAVTENLEDWSGDYIMTYRVDEDRLMALSRVFLNYTTYIGDTTNINQYFDNTTGFVEANDNTLALRIKIEPSENSYTLNLNESGYLGWLSGNSMVAAETVESSNYEWTLSYVNDTIKILNVADPTRIIRYNTSSPRFAVYSLTSSVKNAVVLYKYYGPEIVDPTYTLTVAESIVNGSIELSTYEASAGTVITVTATPDEGYKLETLSYTYNETVTNIDTTAMTFVMPHADVEVMATFKLIPTTEYTITIADGIVNGTVVASAETALEDTQITVEATPDEGYVLETLTYVYGNEEPIDITNEMGFIMPAADVTINATFAELPEAYFEIVTENLDDWTGEYIMAYRVDENTLPALSMIDKIGSNYVGIVAEINEYCNSATGLIEANDNTIAIRIAIEPSENGYTLNLNNNGYLGWLTGNTMVAAETVENSNYEWTISYENDTMKIVNVADNNRIIRYNPSAPRFAAYTLTSSIANTVDLYKYYGPEIVETTYTLAVAEGIENGIIELSTYEATAGSTITVTATPDEGYVLESLSFSYEETTNDIDLASLTFTMPAANVTVSATFVGEAEVPAITNEILPIYIQGKDGTNNNRLPYAYRVTISNLTPNATYRYTNQVVSADDNANYDGVGNAIYVDCDGDFARTTSCNLTDAGNYGEFTTDENGEYSGWFITEATGNSRFAPGNHVYMRIRINDGNEGTTAAYKLTTSDYATVINFGTENDATQGTALVGKTQENDKNFVFLFDNEQGEGRPVYGTTIENTGVDYSSVSQYASFYQNQVYNNSGFWGGIIPNANENGIRFVGMYDNCTGEATNSLVSEDGVWGGISTVNPTGGISDVILIDFTILGVNETESGITIWNRTNEIVVDMTENDSYRMTVYNLLGQPVMSRDINGAGTHTLTHKLSNGLYIIDLRNNDNVFSTKIVVR